MLNNNAYVLCTAVQYVLLFLVLAVNLSSFEFCVVTRSYSSRLFLCALAPCYPSTAELVAVVTFIIGLGRHRSLIVFITLFGGTLMYYVMLLLI